MTETITRLAIVQESGIQLYSGRYEKHIHEFIPCDDEEFGKQYVAKLNRNTDLPFYLTKVEVKIVGKMEEYTDKRLVEEGIQPLAS